AFASGACAAPQLCSETEIWPAFLRPDRRDWHHQLLELPIGDSNGADYLRRCCRKCGGLQDERIHAEMRPAASEVVCGSGFFRPLGERCARLWRDRPSAY